MSGDARRPRHRRSTHHSLLAVLLATLVACGQPVASPSAPSPLPDASASPAPATPPASPSGSLGPVAAVRADLEKLVLSIERNHPDLFRDMTEAEWRRAIDRLDALIPELVPDQPERLMVEFRRLAALPGVAGGRNGHMSIEPLEPRPVLGIVTYTFADGVYVTRALPPNQDLVGSRIKAVEGRPIHEVQALIAPLIASDNEHTFEIWFIDAFRQPEVLVGLGVLDAVGPVELTVELADGTGRTAEIGLVPPERIRELPMEDLDPLSWVPEDENREFQLLHYLPERPEAVWTSRMGEWFWWTELHDGATLYVRQNLVEPPSESQLAGVLEAARAPGVQRVVFDLRHNLGGEDTTGTLRTFQDPAIDQPGRLFVITSTNVYSATPPLVSGLDRTTDAILVGEPTGGAPLFFAGGLSVQLDALPIPLVVDIPRFLVGATDDERLTIEPDLPVPLTGANYFAGRDAALEAILADRP